MNKTTNRLIASINSSYVNLKQEILILFSILVLFLLVNLTTYTRFPIVWLDEGMFTDPAANLYLGHGFKSSIWHSQNMNEFWAGYPPLYAILLYGWMRLFGFSLPSVRSLNYILIVAAVTIIWLAVTRLSLVTSTMSRISLVLIILLGYGVSLNYRSGRVDCTNILVTSLAFLAYSIVSVRLRLILLACIGVFFPLSGLQTLPYTVILCCLLLIFLGKSFLKEAVSLGIGIVIGIACLYIFYSSHGVWDGFVASVRRHSAYGVQAAAGGFDSLMAMLQGASFTRDPSFVSLFIASVLLIIYQIKIGSFKLRSPITFGLVASICTTIGVFAVGKFPTYYSWMAYIPLAITTFSAFSRIKLNLNNLLQRLFVIFIIITSLCGWTLQTVLAVSTWSYRDHTKVEEFVNKNIKSSDWVYFDESAYYPLRKKAAAIFNKEYLRIMSPEEKEQVSALVINPDDLDKVTKQLGGEWIGSSDILNPHKVNDRLFSDTYKLQVWRRKQI
ncbi:hypothetical protein FACHB389_31590 [Nostoc calcicola FACHB-389]|nr:hypothetical protein [Nostoc calcicola FACHB-3891]OKH21542.1 hypothetical protein FACHB389_31590 [Nostoc calcicola FACHB-389]